MNDGIVTTLKDQIPEETVNALDSMKEQMQDQIIHEKDEEEVEEEILPDPQTDDFESLGLGKDEYTLNDLLKIKVDKIPFFVEGLIPKNNLSILAGPSDVGKSTLYSQLVKQIITGETSFLWRKLNTKSRNVLVVSTEDDEVVFKIRMMRQLEGVLPTENQGNRLRLWPNGMNLIPRLEEFLKQRKVDLIIVDALSDVFKGDLNSGNATRDFLGQLSSMAKKHRTSILVVHHARKTDSDNFPHKDKLLGSVGIEGLSRETIFMSRIKDKPEMRGLHIVKGNYVDDELKSRSDVLLFEKESLTFTKIDDTDRQWVSGGKESKPGVKRDPELVERARQLQKEGRTLGEIGQIVGKNKSTISRWLKPARIKFTVDESFVVP